MALPDFEGGEAVGLPRMVAREPGDEAAMGGGVLGVEGGERHRRVVQRDQIAVVPRG